MFTIAARHWQTVIRTYVSVVFSCWYKQPIELANVTSSVYAAIMAGTA